MGKEKADTIVLETLAQVEGRDVYEYQAGGGKLTVRGSSAVAMCRGVYDYLRANNMGTVGWAGPQGRWHNAGTLLLWRGLLALRGRGVARLDLGGIDTRRAPGIARFKLGTGATPYALAGTYL